METSTLIIVVYTSCFRQSARQSALTNMHNEVHLKWAKSPIKPIFLTGKNMVAIEENWLPCKRACLHHNHIKSKTSFNYCRLCSLGYFG